MENDLENDCGKSKVATRLAQDLIGFGYDNFPHLLLEEMNEDRIRVVNSIVGYFGYDRACYHQYFKRNVGLTTWTVIATLWLCSRTEEYEKEFVRIRLASDLSAVELNNAIGGEIPDTTLRRWIITGRLQFGDNKDIRFYDARDLSVFGDEGSKILNIAESSTRTTFRAKSLVIDSPRLKVFGVRSDWRPTSNFFCAEDSRPETTDNIKNHK